MTLLFYIIFASIQYLFNAGQIYSLDIRNYWQNQDYIERVDLYFILENPINSEDYIKLTFPIDIGTITVKLEGGSQIQNGVVDSATKPIYFINGVTLKALMTYKMEIFIGQKPSSSGLKGLVKMSTQTDKSANTFILDETIALGYWSVAPNPSTSTLIVHDPIIDASASSVRNNPNSEYGLEMVIQISRASSGFITQKIPGGSILNATLSDTDFVITECSLIDYDCQPADGNDCRDIRRPNSWKCTPDYRGFVVDISSNVIVSQQFRVRMKLRNPGSVKSTSISVWHTTRGTGIIYEIKTGVNFASVSSLTVTISPMETLWGIPALKQYPCPSGIFQPAGTIAGTSPVVNNLQAKFTVNKAATGYEYGVEVVFGKSTRLLALLEGSIIHSGFKPITNGEITCSFAFKTADFSIVCRGIGVIEASNTYTIGARVYAKPYVGSDSGNDESDGVGYPKVQVFFIKGETSNALTLITDGPGYSYYKNFNMIPNSDKNIGSFVDSIGNSVMSGSWALSYKRSSSATNPFVPATMANILEVLCLFHTGTATDFYENVGSKNCSTIYKYGIFNDQHSVSDGILFFINGAKMGPTLNFELHHILFTQNMHVTHKFLMHKAFVTVAGKKFGLNLMGGIFSDSPSKSSSIQSCSDDGALGTFCYPFYNSADSTFDNGIKSSTNAGKVIYLFNKFDIVNSLYNVLTITCVPKTAALSGTDSKQNCAFYGASRTIDTKDFPGFEFYVNSAGINAISKSSLYPDANILDIAYCLYFIPVDDITVGGLNIGSMTVEKAIGNIQLKGQAIFNYFHINVLKSSNDIHSQLSILNGACVHKSDAPEKFTSNDGNHIPIFLRIHYKANIPDVVHAAAIFFTTKGNMLQAPSTMTNGIYSISPKPSTTTDLSPHHLSSQMYSIPSSNKVGSTLKIDTRGYNLVGATGIIASPESYWNYQPYVLIKDGSHEIDLYVAIKQISTVTTKETCDSFYKISNAVVAFLTSKGTGNPFYNVLYAFNIYATRKYKTTGLYSAKYSFSNLILDDDLIVSAAGLEWNEHKLLDVDSCALSSSMYPITTAYKIGTTKNLQLSFRTSSNNKCKNVRYSNFGYPGSAITFSILTNLYSPAHLVNRISNSATSMINTTSCAKIGLTSSVFTFNSKKLEIHSTICSFKGSADLDISSQVNTNFELQLNDTVPWFWGINTHATPISLLSEILTTVWSLNGKTPLASGQKYASNQPANSIGITASCTTLSYTPVYLATNTQKLSWALSSQIADIILPEPLPFGDSLVSTSDQNLLIEDDLTTAVGANIEAHDCVFGASQLSCQVSLANPILTYKATPNVVNTQYTLPKSTYLGISLYASYTGTTILSGVKHKTKVYFLKSVATVNDGKSEMKVLDCGSIGTDIRSQTARDKLMTISSVLFPKTRSMVTSFEINFGFPIGIGFWKNNDNANVKLTTVFDLGSLWNSISLATNVRCQVFTMDNIVSNAFKTYSRSDRIYTLTQGAVVENLASYKFKCYGALSPATNTNKVKLTISSGKGSLAENEFQIDAGAQKDFNISNVSTSSARFITKGFSSIWTFNIKFVNNLVGGKSYIYLHFPIGFSPRLSPTGKVSCYMNNTPVYCFFITNFQISISTAFSVSASNLFLLKIMPIIMPIAYGDYKKIAVQLDDNNDPLDGILEQAEVDIVTPLSEITGDPIPLLHYNLSNYNIREPAFHFFTISTVTPLTANGVIYAYFGESFAESFKVFSSFSVCSIMKEGGSINIATKCEKEGNYFVKITTAADTIVNNIYFYHIQIGMINNPSQILSSAYFPLLFVPDSTESAISLITSSGYVNSTFSNFKIPTGNLEMNFKSESGDIISGVQVFQGYFGTRISLEYPVNMTSSGLKIKPIGDYINSTVLWQEINGKNQLLTILSGENIVKFEIAALESFAAGSGYWQWEIQLNDTRISPVAALPFVINITKCTISPKTHSLILPNNTKQSISLPIEFDFSKCMPIDSIYMVVNVTANIEFTYSMKSTNQTLTNTYDNLNRKLIFYVFGKPGANANRKGEISFFIMGNNSNAYVISPTKLEFETIAINENINSPAIPVIESSPGEVQITFDCKEAAIIYYYFGIGVSSVTQAEIWQQTEEKGIDNTIVDQTTATSVKYGWGVQSSSTLPFIMRSVGDVKSRGIYSLYGYCVNQFQITNTIPTVTWVQADINANVGLALFPLNRLPSVDEGIVIINAICKFIQAKKDMVGDVYQSQCTNLASRRLLESRIIQSSTTAYNYAVFIHPNPFASNSKEVTEKINILRSFNFTTLNFTNLSQTSAISFSEFSLPATAPIIDASTKINASLSTSNSTVLEIKSSSNYYVYLCVYSNSIAIAPNLTQVKTGKTSNGADCVFKTIGVYFDKNVLSRITITGLVVNTQYKVSFSFASQNIGSRETFYSDIRTFEFATQSRIFGLLLKVSFLLLIIAFLL